jgi:hypothetical protein
LFDELPGLESHQPSRSTGPALVGGGAIKKEKRK